MINPLRRIKDLEALVLKLSDKISNIETGNRVTYGETIEDGWVVRYKKSMPTSVAVQLLLNHLNVDFECIKAKAESLRAISTKAKKK